MILARPGHCSDDRPHPGEGVEHGAAGFSATKGSRSHHDDCRGMRDDSLGECVVAAPEICNPRAAGHKRVRQPPRQRFRPHGVRHGGAGAGNQIPLPHSAMCDLRDVPGVHLVTNGVKVINPACNRHAPQRMRAAAVAIHAATGVPRQYYARFAAYLAENRELIANGRWRVLGLNLPEPRHFLPIALAWGFSVLVLVGQKDLGSSLLFFTLFVVLLWVATERASFLAIGGTLFAIGAVVAWRVFSNVQSRVTLWLDPWSKFGGTTAGGDKGRQAVQAWFAFANGGLFGTGLGQGSPNKIPAVQNDYIFAAIGEELGLVGSTAILIAFLLMIGAGLSIAVRSQRTFEKLLATGLTTIRTLLDEIALMQEHMQKDDVKKIKLNTELFKTFTGGTFDFKTPSDKTLFNVNFNYSTQEFRLSGLTQNNSDIKVGDYLNDFFSSIEFPNISGMTKLALYSTIFGDGNGTLKFSKSFNQLDRLLKRIFKLSGSPKDRSKLENQTDGLFDENDEDEEFYFDFLYKDEL